MKLYLLSFNKQYEITDVTLINGASLNFQRHIQRPKEALLLFMSTGLTNKGVHQDAARALQCYREPVFDELGSAIAALGVENLRIEKRLGKLEKQISSKAKKK